VHFGIVPLEGMYNGAIVVACNSGGPLESIGNDGVSGLTLKPDPKLWGEEILKLLDSDVTSM